MRIRKMKSVDVQLHDSTKVKLKTAGNTSVVQFTAGVNKSCPVQNLSKDTYLDKKTGEVKQRRKLAVDKMYRNVTKWNHNLI